MPHGGCKGSECYRLTAAGPDQQIVIVCCLLYRIVVVVKITMQGQSRRNDFALLHLPFES